jgi:hypothetical protein
MAECFRYPEVSDQRSPGREHNIIGLDVAVDHAALVGIRKPLKNVS